MNEYRLFCQKKKVWYTTVEKYLSSTHEILDSNFIGFNVTIKHKLISITPLKTPLFHLYIK
jgi:hypothetical protein